MKHKAIYLVRHAHAVWGPDEMRPLSAQGISDTEMVADLLAEYPIQAIYSSPYLRALQTIQPLSGRSGIDIQIEPELKERCLSTARINDFHKAVKKTWADPNFSHPGGESNEEVKIRAVRIFSKLQEHHSNEHFVISSHGNFLALLMQHFDPKLDYEFWKGMTFPDIYRLSMIPHHETIIDRIWSS